MSGATWHVDELWWVAYDEDDEPFIGTPVIETAQPIGGFL